MVGGGGGTTRRKVKCSIRYDVILFLVASAHVDVSMSLYGVQTVSLYNSVLSALPRSVSISF